ncbi:uncharacterized protein LTHEOB_684 [Lasiodiplodia theobromae]|uniref:uncharacterized protein n=1 Tax=Lasiodiplodia theobromae TaxID=45133 RepID=UPI0015C3936C|nr:uncharacterized protein LTHEOB_684 [Lasiodiplodia theobromae]KAF4540742.1 hypothetical protein LTHEOB_684 [Lasiodiplodia theobromae]
MFSLPSRLLTGAMRKAECGAMRKTGREAMRAAMNLWEAALQDLEPEERATISKHTQDTKPTDVLQIVEKRGQEAWKNRISFKGKSGEVVFLHDIFAKVARWVKKFVEVGDVAVQYDPAHAALPWAAVRFILQASINDIQRQAAVLEIVEDVARTIPLGAVHECLYLTGPSAAAESLKASLTKLYTLCWSSLAKALHHHDQSKMRLISHISKSQNRNEKLLRMMDDIKMPVSRIEAYVEETQDTLDEMKRDRILDSISTIPYPQHHAKVSRNVLSGTGKWLLDHQVVRNWFLSSASEILWLHGIPGSGKSCLVSVILEKLIEESAHCPSSRPVYFYCNRNPAERERADPTQILRSILRQLSMPWSTKTLPRSVMDKFDKERGSFFDLGDTLDLIIDIIKSRTITFIVLDALDECDANLRFELTDALETILRESQSLVKIFVSSRNDLDLVCWLRDYPNKEILSSDNQVDLAAFVDDEVNRRVDGRPRRLLRARKISDALRDDIKKTLKAQAQGMFRWAELQLQYLCKLLTEEDIRQRLGALPKDLTGIYHDIYQRNMSELRDTDPQYETDAKKIFHLMLSSYQPWGPVDMANMLEPAPNAALRKPEKVFGLTFHLITHDKELNILRFAHLSVREFFETNLSEFAPLRNMEANVAACFDYLEKTREFGYRPLLYPSQWWFSNVMELPIKEISAQSTNHLVEFLLVFWALKTSSLV